MKLNDAGQMVSEQWLALKSRFPYIELHEYIIMPNHFHGIIEIVGAPLVGAQNPAEDKNPEEGEERGHPRGVPQQISQQIFQQMPQPKTKTVGEITGAFKSITTVKYIQGVNQHNWRPFNERLWQRNFWEHIIKTEQAYYNISEYILDNPAKWEEDSLYKY